MAANSFLFEMVPIYMGGNNENDRVTSPESVSIYLNVNWYIFQESFSAIVFQWGSKLERICSSTSKLLLLRVRPFRKVMYPREVALIISCSHLKKWQKKKKRKTW